MVGVSIMVDGDSLEFLERYQASCGTEKSMDGGSLEFVERYRAPGQGCCSAEDLAAVRIQNVVRAREAKNEANQKRLEKTRGQAARQWLDTRDGSNDENELMLFESNKLSKAENEESSTASDVMTKSKSRRGNDTITSYDRMPSEVGLRSDEKKQVLSELAEDPGRVAERAKNVVLRNEEAERSAQANESRPSQARCSAEDLAAVRIQNVVRIKEAKNEADQKRLEKRRGQAVGQWLDTKDDSSDEDELMLFESNKISKAENEESSMASDAMTKSKSRPDDDAITSNERMPSEADLNSDKQRRMLLELAEEAERAAERARSVALLAEEAERSAQAAEEVLKESRRAADKRKHERLHAERQAELARWKMDTATSRVGALTGELEVLRHPDPANGSNTSTWRTSTVHGEGALSVRDDVPSNETQVRSTRQGASGFLPDIPNGQGNSSREETKKSVRFVGDVDSSSLSILSNFQAERPNTATRLVISRAQSRRASRTARSINRPVRTKAQDSDMPTSVASRNRSDSGTPGHASLCQQPMPTHNRRSRKVPNDSQFSQDGYGMLGENVPANPALHESRRSKRGRRAHRGEATTSLPASTSIENPVLYHGGRTSSNDGEKTAFLPKIPKTFGMSPSDDTRPNTAVREMIARAENRRNRGTRIERRRDLEF